VALAFPGVNGSREGEEWLELVKTSRDRGEARKALLRHLAREKILSSRREREELADSFLGQVMGCGPLDPLFADEEVTDIMVNGPEEVYVEKGGRLIRTGISFSGQEELDSLLQRILGPLGRRLDHSSPFVDARLPDGSRLHAIIPPLSLRGTVVTIRRFRRHFLELEELVRTGSLSREMADFLVRAVRERRNLVISGGTGSGKTTLLNALSAFIPPGERVVTIEDAAELRLQTPHVISLEARPASVEGKGEVNLSLLLRNALRMRPDRIIIGEVRGPEAFHLLQALHTGHEGSLTTVHANGPEDAFERIVTMAMMAGEGIPFAALRDQAARVLQVIVHLGRFPDGARRVTGISALDLEGRRIRWRHLFRWTGEAFRREWPGEGGEVLREEEEE